MQWCWRFFVVRSVTCEFHLQRGLNAGWPCEPEILSRAIRHLPSVPGALQVAEHHITPRTQWATWLHPTRGREHRAPPCGDMGCRFLPDMGSARAIHDRRL